MLRNIWFTIMLMAISISITCVLKFGIHMMTTPADPITFERNFSGLLTYFTIWIVIGFIPFPYAMSKGEGLTQTLYTTHLGGRHCGYLNCTTNQVKFGNCLFMAVTAWFFLNSHHYVHATGTIAVLVFYYYFVKWFIRKTCR